MYIVGWHASLAVGHILRAPILAAANLLLDILHSGLPHMWEHGLTPQQCENVAVAKAGTRSQPGCLAT
eukprot:1260084-Lingulodinium_polyedra.AAC.1